MGLSFLIPNVDVRQARERVDQLISEINAKVLRDKSLNLILRVRCSTSWLELSILNPQTQVELKTNIES